LYAQPKSARFSAALERITDLGFGPRGRLRPLQGSASVS
jgi:hypothetical protein